MFRFSPLTTAGLLGHFSYRPGDKIGKMPMKIPTWKNFGTRHAQKFRVGVQENPSKSRPMQFSNFYARRLNPNYAYFLGYNSLETSCLLAFNTYNSIARILIMNRMISKSVELSNVDVIWVQTSQSQVQMSNISLKIIN